MGRQFHAAVLRIHAHAQDAGLDPAAAFLWLDVFAINQHPGVQQEADLAQLQEAISGAKHGTLFVLDDKGEALTRIWCLFEIHKTVNLRQAVADFIVLLPDKADFDALNKIWTELDVEKAKATVEVDRRQILHDIQQSEGGYNQLNHSIKKSILRSSKQQAEIAQNKIKNRTLLWPVLEKHSRMLRAAGDFESAFPLMDEVMMIIREQPAQETRYVANSYNNMGSLLQDMGKLDEALDCFQKSLAIRLKVLGVDHPSVASSYNNMGALMKDMGKSDAALGCFEKSLAIRLKELGVDHPEVARSYNNMGALLQDMGKSDEALGYYEKDLAISLKVLGADHPDVATSYNNMGLLLKAMCKFAQALGSFEKSLAIKLKVLGAEHPSVATSYNNMGALLQDMGKLDEALGCFQKSLAIRLKVLGAEHPSVATSYWWIGDCYTALGKPSQAQDCYRRRDAIRSKLNKQCSS